MNSTEKKIIVYIDADACPVKAEVARVAMRHKLEMIFVANQWMKLSEDWMNTRLEVVGSALDEADDWIVEHAQKDDVVITSDIPLADRAIKAGSHVIEPTGRVFTPANIGNILATRDLMDSLRGAGEITGGPAPFSQENRSKFLQVLEQKLQDIKRS